MFGLRSVTLQKRWPKLLRDSPHHWHRAGNYFQHGTGSILAYPADLTPKTRTGEGVGNDEIDRLLAGISAPSEGKPAWPPLALLKALLLATWHDLSDVRLAEALDDRASFRRFCGFAAHKPTPERTAFVRFRAELVRRGRLVAHNAAWCTDHGCGRTAPYPVRVRRGGRSSGVLGPACD